MVFSGIPFLYFFLLAIFLLYFVAPTLKLKNVVLLLFSFTFYAAGEPRYMFLMLFTITQAYVFGLLMERGKNRRLWFLLTLTFAILPLAVCKYGNFILENISLIPGISFRKLNITLPVGISFYTFQLIGYSADVYMGRVHAQKNWGKLALYISLFPQLIAGPIVRYSNVEYDIDNRTHSLDKFSAGVIRFSIGLGKKILIANTLGELCEGLGTSALGTWVTMIAASLQIYYDFSGYSDMAIGMGHMFGFHFLENFNYPFISKSVAEFWRRWHMSLGSWFRDYVYIPLGGNRVSLGKWIRNILVVWMFTGLWHGAEWNFVIWGLYFAVFLVLEKALKNIIEKIPTVLRHILVLFVIGISFTIFNSATIVEAGRTVLRLFDFTNLTDTASLYYTRSYALTLLAACVGATPLLRNFFTSQKTEKIRPALAPVFMLFVVIVSSAYIVDGSFNPFLYFRF